MIGEIITEPLKKGEFENDNKYILRYAIRNPTINYPVAPIKIFLLLEKL